MLSGDGGDDASGGDDAREGDDALGLTGDRRDTKANLLNAALKM